MGLKGSWFLMLEKKCRLVFLTRLLFMINDICLLMHFRYIHCILTLSCSSWTRVNFTEQLHWIMAGFTNQHNSVILICWLKVAISIWTCNFWPWGTVLGQDLSIVFHSTENTATARLNAKKGAAIFIKVNVYLLFFYKTLTFLGCIHRNPASGISSIRFIPD